MINQMNSIQALLSAISQSDKPISILVGSPISAPEQSSKFGVSSVSAIVEMIEEYVKKDRELLDNYKNCVTSNSSTDRYQDGFEFLNMYTNQNVVNSIIEKAVKNAYDEANQRWNIPTGINNLSEIISNRSLNINNIITTNFDPLIEEGLKNHNVIPLKTILQSDGSLSEHDNEISNSIRVIHLHGFWKKSDTLHTPKQLTTKRPALKASLLKILRDSTLLVIAYGGWDDIFIESLKEITYDTEANVDVLWAFYEQNPDIVLNKYKKLFDAVDTLSQRGRFRLYYGIECNSFFAKLNSRVSANNLKVQSDKIELKKNDIKEAIFSSHSADLKVITNKTLNIKNSPAHKNIRLVEQTQFIDELKINNTVSLVSDWGMDRDGFLFSIIENSFSSLYKKKIYNLDLNECKTVDDINEKFKQYFGHNIQSFASLISDKEDITLLFEKIGSLDDLQWSESFLNLIEILADFLPQTKIILSGDSSLSKLNFPTIYLKPLSEPDISTYIQEHPEGNHIYLTQGYFDTIVRLSSGLPLILDSILNQLKIVNIETLIESEDEQKFDIDNYNANDPIPIQLKNYLSEYECKKNTTRHYYLLEILSVLNYGETFKRLRYFDSKYPFTIDDFLELQKSGLISSSENLFFLKDKPIVSREPILTIHPLIGKLIRQNINKENLFNIVSRSLNLIFGDAWNRGDIKFNNQSLIHLYDVNNSGPGNAHILICSFLRYAIENDMRREIKSIFNLALAFFKFLENNFRYKDLIFSATEIKVLVKDTSEPISIERLHYSLAKGLRMRGYDQESIDEMKLAFESESSFTKPELASGNLNIALAYNQLKEKDKAIKYSQLVQKLSKPNNASYIHSELVIAENSPKVSRLENLLKVKRKAEKYKFDIIKSQAIIEITRLDNDTIKNEQLLEIALKGLKNEVYSRYCVLVEKNIGLLNSDQVSKISQRDIAELCNVYSYSYTQRIDVLLNRVHRILWSYFSFNKDIDSLLTLFKYSSFIWRLSKNSELEKINANLLSAFEFEDLDSLSLDSVRYAKIRIKTLN